ncbi:hypothetical protein [Listeria booriae]|uniref:hypothetical protein n=1 Tax=Listeria booriae TaxID=1552123 RepID=UPI001629C9E2|nr:hypothetical protein [Listeria booriae]MBC1504514.1 hypothetical protein [Listeria booriae]
MNAKVFANIEWNGKSATLRIDEATGTELIDILEIPTTNYELDKDELEIHDYEKLSFLDEEYIETVTEFDDFTGKYAHKCLSDLKYFSKRKLNVFPMNFHSKETLERYNFFIDNNNIDLRDVDKEMVKIPPDLFYQLNKMYHEHEGASIDSLNYLTEIFVLFAITEKSKLIKTTESFSFEFTFTCEGRNNHILVVPWGEWEYFKNDAFYKCYDWIITKSEEGFKLETLLDVLRQYFSSLADISDTEDFTPSLDSILKRILLYETKLYFEQQNKLREEFINYQKMELDAKSSVMKNLLGLITTVGLAYYGRIVLLKNFKIIDKNRDIAIIFIFALIAIIFFAFVFWVNYMERKRYYRSLRKIYTEKFAFSSNDFDSIVEKPTFLRKQWLHWVTLSIFGLITLGLIYFYW